MLSQSDKVTLTKYPALPSLCRVCNFSADGKRDFVDFQLSFDVDGAINICSSCMVNIVQALGFVSPEEAKLNQETISTLTAQVNELSDNNERLNSTLDSILGIRPDLVRDRLLTDEGASEQSDDSIGQLTLAFEGDSDSAESDETGIFDADTIRGLKDLGKSTGDDDSDDS